MDRNCTLSLNIFKFLIRSEQLSLTRESSLLSALHDLSKEVTF